MHEFKSIIVDLVLAGFAFILIFFFGLSVGIPENVMGFIYAGIGLGIVLPIVIIFALIFLETQDTIKK